MHDYISKKNGKWKNVQCIQFEVEKLVRTPLELPQCPEWVPCPGENLS